jgi:hypothetical protein
VGLKLEENIMVKKIKALLGIVCIAIVVYLVSLASVSVAEVGSAAGEERLADVTVSMAEELPESLVADSGAEPPVGRTISLEACVVRVEIEALENSMGDSGYRALSSISAGQVLTRVEADEAEVVSSVKVLVAEGAVAEIATEQNAREKEKDQAKETGEHAEWETAASLRAEVIEIDARRVAIEFGFRQIISERGASGESDAENEEEHAEVFEVSSGIGLAICRPIIAGAKKSESGTMFLILYAEV